MSTSPTLSQLVDEYLEAYQGRDDSRHHRLA